MRVMVPPGGMTVYAIKAKVKGTKDFPTTRSEEAMMKDTDETAEKIPPDDNAFESKHTFICNLTPTEPFVGGPIVKPLMVMVTNADGAIVAPDVVITTAVAEVAPHVAVKPATLLAPEVTVGVTDEAKKLEGYTSVKKLPERIEED